MTTIAIRSYTRADHKAVVALFVDGMMEYCPPGENEGLRYYVGRSLREDMTEEGLNATYLAPRCHYWVATMPSTSGEEEIVATVAAVKEEERDDNRCEMKRLSVRADVRRQKVATQLIAPVEKWAKEQGYRAVTLNTGWEMVPAIKLYESLGYTFTHQYAYESEPDIGSGLFFYEKPL